MFQQEFQLGEISHRKAIQELVFLAVIMCVLFWLSLLTAPIIPRPCLSFYSVANMQTTPPNQNNLGIQRASFAWLAQGIFTLTSSLNGHKIISLWYNNYSVHLNHILMFSLKGVLNIVWGIMSAGKQLSIILSLEIGWSYTQWWRKQRGFSTLI